MGFGAYVRFHMVFNTVELLVCMLYPTIALLSRAMQICLFQRSLGRRGGLYIPTTHRLKGLTVQKNTSNIYRVWIVPRRTPYILPTAILGLRLLVAESIHPPPGGIRDISPPRSRGAVGRYPPFLSKAFATTPKNTIPSRWYARIVWVIAPHIGYNQNGVHS